MYCGRGRRLSIPFCSPFQVLRQELHARDCILQLPYTVSKQVLRRNFQLPTYIRPYHAHLDDTGDLARLRVHGHAVGVEEVVRHLRSGRAYRPSTLDSRRPSDHDHNFRGVEGREDGAGRRECESLPRSPIHAPYAYASHRRPCSTFRSVSGFRARSAIGL
jgi:hypothetical protein